MITKEEAIELCKKKQLNMYEIVQVIERYIFDKKNVTVKIKNPNNTNAIMLADIAFNSCCRYYLNL
jgi:septum formation topological specificity factor MinE